MSECQIQLEKESTAAITSDPTGCPACGAGVLSPSLSLSNIRDWLTHDERSFDFPCCRECGSYCLSLIPTAPEIQGLYPESYTVRPPQAESGIQRVLKGVEWRSLFEAICWQGARSVVERAGMRRGRVLEVGCQACLWIPTEDPQSGCHPERSRLQPYQLSEDSNDLKVDWGAGDSQSEGDPYPAGRVNARQIPSQGEPPTLAGVLRSN